jgi:hypothetical protein
MGKLDTEIAVIREMQQQSFERFDCEQWQVLAARHVSDSHGFKLGDRQAFAAARVRAETFFDRGRWVLAIAVDVMTELADAMGWVLLVPTYEDWSSYWKVEYLMGYASGRAHADGAHAETRVSTYTVSVGIDIWEHDHSYDPDWVPELAICFPDNCEFVALTDELVGDESRFREACAAAIVEAYRQYALPDS